MKLPGSVGYASASVPSPPDNAVFGILSAAEPAIRQFAYSYFVRRFQDAGWDLFDQLLAKHGDASLPRQVELLHATRSYPDAWERTNGNDQLRDEFWRQFGIVGLGSDFEHVEYVAQALMSVERFGDVLQFLELYSRRDALEPALHAALIAENLESLLQNQDQIKTSGLREWDFTQMVEILEANIDAIGADRVASLEWAFLGTLGLDPEVPALSRSLATDPSFFASLIATVYRGNGQDAVEPEGDQQLRERLATNAYELLRAWNQPPGLVDGSMDEDVLRAWTDAVVAELEPTGRADHALEHLGGVLLRTPPDSDGVWPGEVVRNFLEERQSNKIESGIYLAVVNERGVVTRGLEDGGVSERVLQDKYVTDADAVADVAPRSAAILRDVARSYDRDARRNDDEAERVRKGLR